MEDNYFDPLINSLQAQFNTAPFNLLIGLRLESVNADRCSARIDMRPELVGNTVHGILHGGVTSSVLDTIGGATATAAAWKQMRELEPLERVKRLGRLGTLDMRIDFLKPGRGEYFLVSGTVLRTGNKVVVTRMEMHNNEQVLIAAGTGTYLY